MLSTARLTVGPIELADAPRIHVWKNDEVIQELSSDEIQHETEEETERRVRRWMESDPNEIIHFGIRLRASGELIGFCHLAMIEKRHRRCRIGVVIGPRELWGRGYGTEACSVIIRHAFEALDLHRIGAETYSTNPRSAGMLQKLGFTREGVLRESVWKPGPVDEYVYGLLRSDWLARST
jgi:RimJ/RimL family protein N-acetyltransferase